MGRGGGGGGVVKGQEGGKTVENPCRESRVHLKYICWVNVPMKRPYYELSL